MADKQCVDPVWVIPCKMAKWYCTIIYKNVYPQVCFCFSNTNIHWNGTWAYLLFNQFTAIILAECSSNKNDLHEVSLEYTAVFCWCLNSSKMLEPQAINSPEPCWGTYKKQPMEKPYKMFALRRLLRKLLTALFTTLPPFSIKEFYFLQNAWKMLRKVLPY